MDPIHSKSAAKPFIEPTLFDLLTSQGDDQLKLESFDEAIDRYTKALKIGNSPEYTLPVCGKRAYCNMRRVSELAFIF